MIAGQLELCLCLQALNESSSFNAQELSVLCWGMAKLHHTPPADWVAALLRDGLEVHHDVTGQSVVLLMWALAKWRLPDIRENGKYRYGLLGWGNCYCCSSASTSQRHTWLQPEGLTSNCKGSRVRHFASCPPYCCCICQWR